MKRTKLNLGSGPSGLNSWLNYDYGILPSLSKHPNVRKLICSLGLLPKEYDVVWPSIEIVDIRKKLPLEDNSIDYIYCSQVIEHFERYEAESILKEVLRVLRPGGIIRISVPDIKKMCDNYLRDSEKKLKSAARIINVLWWGFEKDIPPRGWPSKFSRLFIRDHRWHYDTNSMRELLKGAGYEKIKFVGFRKGKTPDLAKLEIEIHRRHSLYVEAEK